MGEADRLESSARIKDKPILRFDHATVRDHSTLHRDAKRPAESIRSATPAIATDSADGQQVVCDARQQTVRQPRQVQLAGNFPSVAEFV